MTTDTTHTDTAPALNLPPLWSVPMDAPDSATPTTLAAEAVQRAPHGGLDRPALCVAAPDAPSATATALAYMLDCERSGRGPFTHGTTLARVPAPCGFPVPVALIVAGADPATPRETAAIRTMIATAARMQDDRRKAREARALAPVTTIPDPIPAPSLDGASPSAMSLTGR